MHPLLSLPFFLGHREYLGPLLRRLDRRRVSNLAVALSAYYLRRDRASRYPPFLVVRPTFVCNFSCVMCQKNSTDENPYTNATDLEFRHLERTLREVGAHITLVRLIGGEPLAYRKIRQLLDLLNDVRAPYCIVTNGSLLTPEITERLLRGCVWVSVSIDTADPDDFRAVRRGGKLESVVANIRGLNAARRSARSRTPLVHASMTTFAYNADQMEPMVRFCKAHEMDSLSIGEGSDYHTPFVGPDQLVSNHRDAIRAYLAAARETARSVDLPLRATLPSLDEGAPTQRARSASRCIQLYLEASVFPNLGVVPCIYGSGFLDSLADRALAEVWNGDRYLAARAALRRDERVDFCASCCTVRPAGSASHTECTAHSPINRA